MSISGTPKDLEDILNTQRFKEILSTEEAFLADLRFLQANRTAILNSFPKKIKKDELKKIDLQDAFDLIPELIKAHQKGLNHLQKGEFKEWQTDVRDLGYLHAKYVTLSNKLNARPPKEVSKHFASLPGGNLNMGFFFIKPIQRITKYPLLFNDLQRETPESNSYRLVIDSTKEVLTSVTKAVNESERWADIFDTLIERELKKGQKADLKKLNVMVNLKEEADFSKMDKRESLQNRLMVHLKLLNAEERKAFGIENGIEIVRRLRKKYNEMRKKRDPKVATTEMNAEYNHLAELLLNRDQVFANDVEEAFKKSHSKTSQKQYAIIQERYQARVYQQHAIQQNEARRAPLIVPQSTLSSRNADSVANKNEVVNNPEVKPGSVPIHKKPGQR